jgi:hypothetical protein
MQRCKDCTRQALIGVCGASSHIRTGNGEITLKRGSFGSSWLQKSQQIYFEHNNLNLPATERLGINGTIQYTEVSPEHYVPPHLHITIRLVNVSVTNLFDHIDMDKWQLEMLFKTPGF